jgi:hypothetical protein
MFTQIKQLYPSWEEIDEANLWLAKINFDSKEYFQGINLLAGIKDNKLLKAVNTIKENGLASLNDVEALKRLHIEHPKDRIIGERLAVVLSKEIDSPDDKELLNKLVTAFKLKRSDFIEETPATIYKDVYSVSVMFPFLVNTLDPTPARKRNQFVLDLYEGMKLAIDSLGKQGIIINLRASKPSLLAVVRDG